MIRGWLGHADLTTTNRYAEINTKAKMEALRATEPPDTSAGPRTHPRLAVRRIPAQLALLALIVMCPATPGTRLSPTWCGSTPGHITRPRDTEVRQFEGARWSRSSSVGTASRTSGSLPCGPTTAIDSFYCLPGIDGSHEKGGVEGEVGRFRRRHLVPVPRVGSLAELNELIAAGDRIDDDRHIGRRPVTVGVAAGAELAWMRPLPEVAFDSAAILPDVKVDTKGRICVRQSFYSVPVRLARRRIVVRLGAQSLEAVVDGRVVARHDRSLHKGTEDLVLDHYLEILVRKPGAMPGSTALAQARAAGAFGETHERFWTEARRKLGDGAGTRALIGVLLLHRRLAAPVVIEAMDAALAIGSVDPEVVAIEARRIEARRPPAPVVPIGTGARDVRPAPRLDGYDALLAAGTRS